VLALDDEGIPGDATGRIAIVERVREMARAAGLRDRDLVVDVLVMTAATDSDAPRTTIAALAGVHEAGLATLLGVSNVSHGLPQRALLNAAFLDAAAAAGLDAAIVNPSDHVVMESVRVANQAREAGAGTGLDAHNTAWAAWDAAYAAALDVAAAGADALVAASESDAAAVDPHVALETAVLRGDADAAPRLVDAVIEAGMPASEVIGSVLTPAIQRLGDAFGRGEVFLPQMMIAAEAMKVAVTRVKTHLPASASSSLGLVAFATVKGDIHSIGKDICVSLLESQGFDVNDLGVDVAIEDVVSAAKNADAVCLSALMTTTLPAMRDTVAAVRAADESTPVFVGGAVVTAEWAGSVGAGYSADAPGCVDVVRKAIERSKP
jgi:5-methyltetrahydrofolate--homocysteine methyltransferase